ncbi:YihY/virulence factor BrkB family protein [Anaeromyxobacter oryzae]|uniref:YihY/virulence factor BrkB family protein n=1 Tax=Anaeromyxobacter oryzae TaxID=2918170 RepID=UPI0020C16A43|nr:YihY/virulence factor BrkB family protein [Anaeromyxobacter oryzae]
MPSAIITSPLVRLRTFFTGRIWDVRLSDLPWWKAALYRASRIIYSTARGFFDDRLTVRAAALTYFSVLSVVPFLAFAFAILKGFGAYRTFVQGTVRPYLDETFAPNPALHQAVVRILAFVDTTDFSKLGAVGLVALVYTSITLVSSVEAALNDVFGAKTTRPVLRQVTDYVTLLVTAPLLVFVATTASAAAQSSSVVLFLRDRLGLGPVIDWALGLTPVAVVGLALFAIYVILPNVRIRILSALIGAAVAALLWQGALVLQIQLQMGVARYNAIYSVLGAIPIFLVWTYVSWVIVLLGAEIASSHQDEQSVRLRMHGGEHADQALRESLAIAAVARVTRDFLSGGPRRTASDLAALLEVPAPTVDDVLGALVRGGVLLRAVCGHVIVYVPGGDVDALRATDVRDALRRDPRVDDVRLGIERHLGSDLQQLLRAEEEDRRRSPHDLTLRELADLASERDRPSRGDRDRPDRDREPPAPPPRARDDGDGRAVLDAKQPDVPG